MHHTRRTTAFALLPLLACSAPAEPVPDGGNLRMGVVGQDFDGFYYRLRDAVFEIDGPDELTVSTEDNPTTDVLSLEVAAGPYEVLLDDGWRLERWDPISDATFPVEATLQSENPVSTVVSGTETASVVFTFVVADAGPVTLGDGDLDIDINVNVQGPCDPLVQDCEPGDACYPVDGEYVCIHDAGGQPPYSACEFINVCFAGSFCGDSSLNTSCDASEPGCCLPYCDVSNPSCNTATETCVSLGIGDPNVGACAEF